MPRVNLRKERQKALRKAELAVLDVCLFWADHRMSEAAEMDEQVVARAAELALEKAITRYRAAKAWSQW